MFRYLSIVCGLVSLLSLTAAQTLAADNVVHYSLSFSEAGSMPLPPELAACVGYSGSIYEERAYALRVTEFVAGPNEGSVQLTGTIAGSFTIAPDPGVAGPTYRGSYREKVNLVGTSLDGPYRVVSFTLPATATGTSGATLKFLLRGHAVFNLSAPTGEPKALVDKFTCIQSPVP